MVYDIKSEPGHNITGHPQFQGNSDPLNRHHRSDFYNLIREDKITNTLAETCLTPPPIQTLALLSGQIIVLKQFPGTLGHIYHLRAHNFYITG